MSPEAPVSPAPGTAPGGRRPPLARPPVLPVLQQHVEEAAMLRHVRTVLVRAAHVRLLHLGRLDERIAAHLDGLDVGAAHARVLLQQQLERAGCGEVFAAAACALGRGAWGDVEALADVAAVSPDARRGLLSALGWVEPGVLRGGVSAWLAGDSPDRRALALDACRLHRVVPGGRLTSALRSAHTAERAAALRTVGDLGLLDARQAVLAQADADTAADPLARVAWRSACLLGDGARVARRLWESGGDGHDDALALLSVDLADARQWVRELAPGAETDPARRRRLIRACGLAGDTAAVPYLLERMTGDADARRAGEAFSWLTGADLAAADLERRPPEALPDGRAADGGGPSERAEDEDVALDDAESLPWPDLERVRRWWERQQRTMPVGRRHFLGAPIATDHVQRVLREGTQRHRAVAAALCCMIAPGTTRFPVAAPVPRQRRLLTLGG